MGVHSVEAREVKAVPSGAAVEKCLQEIERSGALPAGVTAAEAAMAVLCTVAHGLTPAAADELGAALGPAARILVQRCVVHEGQEPERFDQDGFVQRVAEHFRVASEDGERIVRVVLRALKRLIPRNEADHLRAQLPRAIAELWRSS